MWEWKKLEPCGDIHLKEGRAIGKKEELPEHDQVMCIGVRGSRLSPVSA
jgi:hypothetical protein